MLNIDYPAFSQIRISHMTTSAISMFIGLHGKTNYAIEKNESR